MAFLNSIALWGSLAAAGVAVPIIIHILSRFRVRRIDWAAMELLRRALRKRRRQIRIEDLILLFLRCLAAALAALALARPALTPSGMQWLGGAPGVAGVLIAVDGSYSMAHKPGVHSRFDLAIERVREIVSTLDPGNPVSLVVMGGRPRIELRNVGYNPERFGQVLKRLKPLPEPLELERCLDEVQKLFAEIKAPVRECYLVTDAQTSSWRAVSDRTKAIFGNISKLGKLFYVPVGLEDSENLAIIRLQAPLGVLRTGSVARYVADIRNTGERFHEKATVRLFLDDNPVDQRVTESLAPGKTTTVSLFAHFERPGIYRVSAQFGPDALPTDNARYAVADIREGVKVLCVDGAPSQPETHLLVKALSPGGAGRSSRLEVETVPYSELSSRRLSDYEVVVLANVPDISRGQARALQTFVREGGGLILFLGENVNPQLLNAKMRLGPGRDNERADSLLPADLVEAVGDASEQSEGWMLSTELSDHPIARVLATMPKEQLSNMRFRRYFKVKLRNRARAVLELAGGGGPLLIDRPFGRGKVLLFTTTADLDWTDMAVHPSYLMVLQQAVTYLTRRPYERPITVGEPLIVALPSHGALSTVPVRDGRGEESSVGVTESEGQMVVTLEHADTPGAYEVEYAKDAPPVKVAVNVDPSESGVKALEKEELAETVAGLRARLIRPGQDVLASIRESRVGRELWRILLLCALAVLILEGFLAMWFSRRITAREASMAVSLIRAGAGRLSASSS